MDITTAQVELFPFAQIDVVAPRRSALRKFIDATLEHGPLAPQSMIAEAMGVSRQRVHQLVSEGRIATVTVNAHKLIPAASFEMFAAEDRPSGYRLK